MSNSLLQKVGALAFCTCLLSACAAPTPDSTFLATVAVVTQEKSRLLTAEAILSATPTASLTLSATATPAPTNTALPTAAFSPTAPPRTTRQASSPTATPSSPSPALDFINAALRVRKTMEGFAGLIDMATTGTGLISCREIVTQYELVVNGSTMDVPSGLSGPYALFRQGVDKFVAGAQGMYVDCRDEMTKAPDANNTISYFNWSSARSIISDATGLINKAIVAAGGYP
jgi:hypothetical protein